MVGRPRAQRRRLGQRATIDKNTIWRAESGETVKTVTIATSLVARALEPSLEDAAACGNT
jgi:hypothetical protein